MPLIPPTPFSHKGRRGSLGILMTKTGVGHSAACGRDARAPRRCVPLWRCVRAGRPRTQAMRTFVLLRAGGTPALPGGASSDLRDALRRSSPLCCCVRAKRSRFQGVRPVIYATHCGDHHLCAAACERDARVPRWCALKCRVFGRDEQCSAFPCAFAPHPPNPLLPQGEKGESRRSDA